MRGVDLVREPFLAPEQQTIVADYHTVLGGLDLPSKSGVPFEEQFGASMQRLASVNLHIAQQIWPYTKPNNQESLEGLSRALALGRAGIDLQLAVFNRSAALGAGLAQAAGDGEVLGQSTSLGYEIITFRARHAVSSALKAFAYVQSTIPDKGVEESAWDRAEQAHEKLRLDCPARLDEEEIEAFEALAEAAPDLGSNLPRLGHSIRIVARIGSASFRYLRRRHQSGTKPWSADDLRGIFNSSQEMIPRPLELKNHELRHTAQTARELVKCLGFAALADDSLASDPMIRLFAYLTHTLRAHDIDSEVANFDRQVARIAKRESKASSRGGSN